MTANTLAILERLISFPTVSSESNLELIRYVKDHLEECGFRVYVLPDESGHKAGLLAKTGPLGKGIILSAHTDVVPVADQAWTRDPFRLTREGDRLYGRGTTDMKGFLASTLALASRVKGKKLKEPLSFSISYDEEVGCLGISKMINEIKEKIGVPRECIIGEPTEMQVAVGHKGKRAYSATCTGESGHSALAPNYLNAIYLACELIASLRDIQDEIKTNRAQDDFYAVPHTTLHVGRISGGTALNIVPDVCGIDYEFRHLPGDDPDMLAERIEKSACNIMARYRNRFPSACISIQKLFSYPGIDTPLNSGTVKFARKIAQSKAVGKVDFGTEAGFFDGIGVPSVICGPGSMSGQGHKPDEFLEISQLRACDVMMDRLLNEITV
ncbi:MAG: acetylornithine deacetylase [Roseovarius sp.]|nr:acetylornithine deacetylase [Roseovarius sp.]